MSFSIRLLGAIRQFDSLEYRTHPDFRQMSSVFVRKCELVNTELDFSTVNTQGKNKVTLFITV